MKIISLTLFLVISFNFFSQQCIQISTLNPYQTSCLGYNNTNGDGGEIYIESNTNPSTVLFTVHDGGNNLGPYNWSTSGTGSFTVINDSTVTYSSSDDPFFCGPDFPEVWIYATSSVDPTCVDSILCVIWNYEASFNLAAGNTITEVSLNGIPVESVQGYLIDTLFIDYCPGDSIEVFAYNWCFNSDTYESGVIYLMFNENIELMIDLNIESPCTGYGISSPLVISASNTNCCVDSSIIDFNVDCLEWQPGGPWGGGPDLNPVCGCDGELYMNACSAYYYGGVLSYTNPSDCVPECNLDYQFTYDSLDCYTIDFSGSGASNYYWQFGDGDVAFGADVSHTFSSNGTYSVSIWGYDTTIVSLFGDIPIYCDTLSFDVIVSCCQVDGFNVITTDDCPLQSYTFIPQSNCSNYIWDFGDGSSLSTGNYVAHEFPNEGQYEVCLYGVDSLGNIVDSVCEIIDISLNCNVSLYNTNQDNTGGLYVNAYGACNFIYDYGDGSPLSTYSFHQYSDIGNYNLCVYGYDVNNEICDTLCEQINITIDTNCQINGMSFSSGQWSCVGNLVDCYVSPFGNAASYLYDFGDGSPITDYLSHWYSEIGIYEVCVFAVNGFGDICDSLCENYEVTEIVDSSAYCCMADFTYTQDNCTVQFTNLSEGNYDDMRWTISLLPYSFIDTTLYGNNPTFTFENSGDYLVTVEPLIGGNYCDTMFRVIHVDDCQPLMYNLLEMQSILIYPNPTTNLITIQSESLLNNKFKIYDQQGREVMNGKLTGKNTEVSLGTLSRGTYTIQVDGNYKPAVIIKQ
ncbi:PKD domain-containing protein [Crocinitomicaceae bacterium]|nr:PKD domain-containing protein [Crocinitomicaceae bacterium]